MASPGAPPDLGSVASDRDPRAFGTVLRKLREARSLSQEELADRAHTSQSYLSLLEKGLRAPSLVTRACWRGGFGCRYVISLASSSASTQVRESGDRRDLRCR